MSNLKWTNSKDLVDACTSLTKFSVIWAYSYPEEEFITGQFLFDALKNLEDYDKLLVLSSRGFAKSTSIRMEMAYLILTSKRSLRIGVVSSTPTQANLQVRNLKLAVESNEIMTEFVEDLKTKAENQIKYKNHHNAIVEVIPIGLTKSIRGDHFRGGYLYLDDCMRDGQGVNILTSANIEILNRAVKKVITPMTHIDTKVRIIGTPLSLKDFYYDEDFTASFKCITKPALDENNQSNFEELYSTQWLHERHKQIGEAEFKAEYQCIPSLSSDSFFNSNSIHKCINKSLPNLTRYKGKQEVILGIDIATSKKSKHATHIAGFKIVGDKLIQTHSSWLEGQPFVSQMIVFKKLIKDLQVDRAYIDNTNKTFNFAFEQGLAPAELIEVNINRATKENMASVLDTLFTHGDIQLLDDERQTEQLLQLQADLDIKVSSIGHGDAFTSCGLVAINYQNNFTVEVISLC